MSSPGFFYSAEDQARNQALAQQQAYAKALMQQGQDPGNAQYGGLRSAGNSLLGAFLAKRSQDKELELAKGAQDRYVTSMAQLLKGNGVPTQSSQVSTAAGTAPQVPREMDPEGNPMAQGQGPGYQPPRQQTQAGQPNSNDFISRLIATGNPQLMQMFAPKIAEQQLGREEKTWEAQQPLSVAKREESQLELDRQEALAKYQKGLPLSTYEQATLNMHQQTLGETMRHDRATEANAAQSAEFGKGMTGRAYNILAQGIKNPALRGTAEYQTAWQILSNPKVDPNTGTVVVPDLSAFAPPISQGQPQQPGPAAPGQPQGQNISAATMAPPQRMPSIQAFAPPNPSQPEALSAGYANRLDAAGKILDTTGSALGDFSQATKSHVPVIGNKLVSQEYQQADQAARDFINAQLRRESGAAIAESEFENARKQYLPQPWDGPEVLAQKKAARDRAVKNMQLSAGNVLLPPGVIQQASPPRGAPMVPQQQGFGVPQAAPQPGTPPKVIRYDSKGNRIP